MEFQEILSGGLALLKSNLGGIPYGVGGSPCSQQRPRICKTLSIVHVLVKELCVNPFKEAGPLSCIWASDSGSEPLGAARLPGGEAFAMLRFVHIFTPSFKRISEPPVKRICTRDRGIYGLERHHQQPFNSLLAGGAQVSPVLHPTSTIHADREDSKDLWLSHASTFNL